MRAFGLLAAVVAAFASLLAFAQAPAPYAAFIGKWQGTWKGGLATTIDIQRIDADGTMHGIYSWGDKPEWGVKAAAVPVNKTKISADGKFSFPDSSKPGSRTDWTFRGDRFEGKRFEKPDGKANNSVTLTRVK